MSVSQRWRGLKALLHDAVDATTDLVEVGHESTARSVRAVTDRIEPLSEPARIVDDVRRVSTRGILKTIRVVNRGVERASDFVIDQAMGRGGEAGPRFVPAMPMRSDTTGSGSWISDAAIGLVNGAVGDHLSDRRNGLDMSMLFRVADHYVSLERDAMEEVLASPQPKVALFVHGLATTEWSWCLSAERYHGDAGASMGSLLERDLSFTPVFLRYNTGRRVADNGRLLARALERFVEAYPVAIEDLTLVGHSMGGLVLRSACQYASREGMTWTSSVRRLFCLGAPHHGAPLAKLGHVAGDVLGRIDLPGTLIAARIIAGRSAGIRDLRDGQIVDPDWLDPAPSPMDDPSLLPHAAHYFVSATITRNPGHPMGRLVGDLMVRAPSAEGARLATSRFAIETFRQGGVMHHELQNHPAIYEVIRRECTCPPSSESRAPRD